MTLGTQLFTYFNGALIGEDAEGNRYYEEKRLKRGRLRKRRWVLYVNGAREASLVPPEWHAWLHYTTDAPLSAKKQYFWEKPHKPNLTGTPLAYRPPGHDYAGGHRERSGADYEAWTPGT